MSKNVKVNTVGLDDLLKLFEEHISIADINSSRYLGEISAAIAKKRIQLNMTQQEFAKHINISQGMVSKWEGGDYNFSIKALAEIAEKLDMELHVDLKTSTRKTDEQIGMKERSYIYTPSQNTHCKSTKSNVINFVDKQSYIDNNANRVYSHELIEM